MTPERWAQLTPGQQRKWNELEADRPFREASMKAKGIPFTAYGPLRLYHIVATSAIKGRQADCLKAPEGFEEKKPGKEQVSDKRRRADYMAKYMREYRAKKKAQAGSSSP